MDGRQARKRHPPARPPGMERGWDEVREKRCLLHGSDTHKMAVVGDPGCFRREGVGRWSRGGWGGGRAWGSALSWKQEMGEGSEEHKLPAAARGRRRPSEWLAEGRKRRGRKGGSKRGHDKQPQRCLAAMRTRELPAGLLMDKARRATTLARARRATAARRTARSSHPAASRTFPRRR